jgi:hypothetical protein
MITTDDIDDYGIPAIIERIRKRVGETPVYLRHVRGSVVKLVHANRPVLPAWTSM